MTALVEKLGHKTFSVRQNASTALLAWGARATPLLKDALGDRDKEVARRAEKLLAQVAEGTEPDLALALLRVTAARRPDGAAAALLDYLPYAPDERVAKQALEALAAVAVRDGKADPVVEKALTGKDNRRRAAAAAVLGKDGGAFAKQPWRP